VTTAVDRTVLPVPGNPPLVRFPSARAARLPSGLGLRTVEHPGPPVVTCALSVPVGSASDPVDHPGLVALTADLFDDGSVKRPSLELHGALDRIGARLGTEVGTDSTTVSLTTLSQYAVQGLRLLAEIVSQPRFDPLDVERVRDLRRSRLRQLKTVPGAVADRLFLETIFGPHPYGHLGLGTDEALASMEAGLVRNFHGEAFRLGPATLVVVGALSHEEAASVAAEAFTDVPAVSATTVVVDAAAVPAPPAPAGRLFVVDRPGAVQTELRIGHLGVRRLTPDYHALLALNMVLGGQFTSRLNQRLREERGYTYGVRTSFDCRRAPGPFSMDGSVQSDATVETVTEVLGEMSGIGRDRPVTADELTLARAALTRGFARGFETAGQVARGLTRLLIQQLPPDYYDTFVPLVAGVDEAAVTEAALTHLRPEEAVVVAVGPVEQFGAGLETLGLGPLQVVDA